MLDKIDKELLVQTASLHKIPQGAYNIRKNGESIGRASSEHITIETNANHNGINIIIKPNTTNESVHIPVILSRSGLTDVVYNDFFVGENCVVTIVAGCGIHSNDNQKIEHDGVHRFFIEKNSKVTYIEKHIGLGKGTDRILNPVTEITLGENAEFNMETMQMSGVEHAERKTIATLGKNSKLNINEKILTENTADCTTLFTANLNGENSSAHIVSRAVAKGNSVQHFKSILNGNNKCFGHTECDAIIVDNGKCFASPEVNALNPESSLIHEAAIGKIAGEQIQKLLTLGLTEEEAQNQILQGFLK